MSARDLGLFVVYNKGQTCSIPVPIPKGLPMVELLNDLREVRKEECEHPGMDHIPYLCPEYQQVLEPQSPVVKEVAFFFVPLLEIQSVSYTHLTLPTILLV